MIAFLGHLFLNRDGLAKRFVKDWNWTHKNRLTFKSMKIWQQVYIFCHDLFPQLFKISQYVEFRLMLNKLAIQKLKCQKTYNTTTALSEHFTFFLVALSAQNSLIIYL